MKIYLLPNIATQSPRRALSAALDAVQRHQQRADRCMRESRKYLRRSRFLQY